MRNEFILHVTCQQNNGQDRTLKSILSKKELNGSLIFEKKVNRSKQVLYRIKIGPRELVKFKKMLDATLIYQSIELFEYRVW